MSDNILLIGNPNTGKTTLFNTLTKSDEHVGNWHGVTVDKKNKLFKLNGDKKVLTDLPGLYSLTSLSFEEQVSIDELISNPDSLIVNICDLNNLEQNLYLTLQLKEMGRNFVLLLNNTNSKKMYSSIDIKKLSSELGVKVVEVNAQNKSAKTKLEKVFNDEADIKNLDYFEGLPIERIEQIIKDDCKKINANSYFCAIKLLENDEKIEKLLNIDPQKKKLIEKLKPTHSCSEVARCRHNYIKNLLKKCVYKKTKLNNGLSVFDKIATHKVWGVVLFLLVMFVAFYLTFFSLGAKLSDLIVKGVDLTLGRAVIKLTQGCQMWVKELFSVGVVGGISALLGFLPQIVLLFLFLGIMEETGYMSRIAFLFDDIFSKLGLSGKSAYTLMMGFGCSTSAIMTARNMESKNSKIKTALLAPYMSCSAKLPIYLLIGGAFFRNYNIFVVFFLYLTGVLISVIIALILSKTSLKSENQSFLLEFPALKAPSAKKILKQVWKNFYQFLVRVGSLLIFVNVIVWVVQSFSFKFSYVDVTGEKSMLETLGGILSPIFYPLGFSGWGPVAALLSGIIAKEVVVSSISIFNGASESTIGASLTNPASAVFFTPASCMSFLVFCLLYIPCASSIAVLRKEVGRKWTFLACIIQFVTAYICAFIVYTIFLVFLKVEKWKILTFVSLAIIVISFIVVFLKRKKKGCLSCDKCKINCINKK